MAGPTGWTPMVLLLAWSSAAAAQPDVPPGPAESLPVRIGLPAAETSPATLPPQLAPARLQLPLPEPGLVVPPSESTVPPLETVQNEIKHPPLIQPKPKVEDSEAFFARIVPLTPPGADQLFQLESEETLKTRWLREAKNWPLTMEFPYAKEPSLPPDAKRTQPLLALVIEPNYLRTHPLWFEQPRGETGEFDLRVIHPIWATGVLAFDAVALPVRSVVHPIWSWEIH